MTKTSTNKVYNAIVFMKGLLKNSAQWTGAAADKAKASLQRLCLSSME
jgi:hypothetical protein